jgi:glutamate carboxypeptidase
VSGGIEVPPLERTPRNRVLWHAAESAAERLGLPLGEQISGGGSDGNTTSLYTATLDGLGPVGDGAHARHEHVIVDRMPERAALLAELLMTPGSDS